MIGESATELIHIGMMVLDNGLTIDEFIEQVFNYPTLQRDLQIRRLRWPWAIWPVTNCAKVRLLVSLSGHHFPNNKRLFLRIERPRRILHATRPNFPP